MSVTSIIPRLWFLLFAITSVQSVEQNGDYDTIENTKESDEDFRSIKSLNFPSIYHATGTITIPSGGIVEPFEAWYAGKYNKSRIDYYGGTVKTFHRADIGEYGTLYEVIPKYDFRKDSHYQGCWKKKGKKKKKIEPQNILPKNVYWPFKMNISQYKYKGTETIGRIPCTKWIAVTSFLNRTDTYTFHATDEENPRPVKLDMKGYDILLTSYYDHYIVDYETFEKWNYEKEKFHIPQVAKRDRWCQKVPKDIGEAGYRSLNPMGELLDETNYEDFEDKFKNYKINFGKEYIQEQEHRKRMHITRHNMRYIHSMNRRQIGFSLDVNHFTDLSDNEFNNRRGLSHDGDEEIEEYEKNIPFLDENFDENERGFQDEDSNGSGSGSDENQENKVDEKIGEYKKHIPVLDEGFDERERRLQVKDSNDSGPGENQEKDDNEKIEEYKKHIPVLDEGFDERERRLQVKDSNDSGSGENQENDDNEKIEEYKKHIPVLDEGFDERERRLQVKNSNDSGSGENQENDDNEKIEEFKKHFPVLDKGFDENEGRLQEENNNGSGSGENQENDDDGKIEEYEKNIPVLDDNFDGNERRFENEDGQSSGSGDDQEDDDDEEEEAKHDRKNIILHGINIHRIVSKKSNIENNNNVQSDLSELNLFTTKFDDLSKDLNKDNSKMLNNENGKKELIDNSTKYIAAAKEPLNISKGEDNSQIKSKVVDNIPRQDTVTKLYQEPGMTGTFANVPFSNYGTNIQTWQNLEKMTNGLAKSTVPNVNGVMINHNLQNGQIRNNGPFGSNLNYYIQNGQLPENVPARTNVNYNIQNGQQVNYVPTIANMNHIGQEMHYAPTIASLNHYIQDGQIRTNVPFGANKNHNIQNGQQVNYVPTIANVNHNIQYGPFRNNVPFGTNVNDEPQNGKLQKNVPTIANMNRNVQNGQQVNYVPIGANMNHDTQIEQLQKRVPTVANMNHNIQKGQLRNNVLGPSKKSSKISLGDIDSNFYKSVLTKALAMVDGVNAKRTQGNHPSPKYFVKNRETGNSVSYSNRVKNIQTDKSPERVNRIQDKTVNHFDGMSLSKTPHMVNGVNAKKYQENNPASRYFVKNKENGKLVSLGNRFNKVQTDISPERVNRIQDKAAKYFDGMRLSKTPHMVNGVNGKRYQENNPASGYFVKNKENGKLVSLGNRFNKVQTDISPERVNRIQDKAANHFDGMSLSKTPHMVNGINGKRYQENNPASRYFVKNKENGKLVSLGNRFNKVQTDISPERVNRIQDKAANHFDGMSLSKTPHMVNGINGKSHQENNPASGYFVKNKENENSISSSNTFKTIQTHKSPEGFNRIEHKTMKYFGGKSPAKAPNKVNKVNEKSYQENSPLSRYFLNNKMDQNAESFSDTRTGILPENVNNIQGKTAHNFDAGRTLREGKESQFGHKNDFVKSKENFKNLRKDVKVEYKNNIKSTKGRGKLQAVKTGLFNQGATKTNQGVKENLNDFIADIYAQNVNSIKDVDRDRTIQDVENSFSQDEGKAKLKDQENSISSKVSLDSTANSSKRSERIGKIKPAENNLNKINSDLTVYDDMEDDVDEDSNAQNSREDYHELKDFQELVHGQNKSNVNVDNGSGSNKDLVHKFSTSEKKKNRYDSQSKNMRGKFHDRKLKKKDEPQPGKYNNFYEPQITNRILKQRINKPLSSFYDYSTKDYENGKSDAERKDGIGYSKEDNDNIWRQPDISEVKPFYMFGVDEMGNDGEDLETLEEDLLMKDDDRFPKEFRAKNKKGEYGKRNKKGSKKKKKQGPVPNELDWRDYGAVAPVQSQGICGSCWTFSTTAAVESAHFLKTGERIKLSEQQLLDCTWYVPHSKEGNHGCMGGWTWKSFAYIKQFGLATYDSYGQYLGMEGSCKTKNLTVGARIDSFMKVKANSPEALKRAIAYYGPATASINTEIKTLKFYKNGIYSDKECNGATDHSVLIVGYGEENGKLYWIVRNSWGTRWGEHGYVKIENGRCGLLKKPYVVILRDKKPLPWLQRKQNRLSS